MARLGQQAWAQGAAFADLHPSGTATRLACGKHGPGALCGHSASCQPGQAWRKQATHWAPALAMAARLADAGLSDCSGFGT
ncbi:unnamed protein product [Euphydryas editha]|uniref:Uncharacterized protein n=1 Tax=Euphydryas editha TaxID=104508 RepID=A0AAU9UBR9_EUPED|nr:unnamed protein product [Euphydryas editha]